MSMQRRDFLKLTSATSLGWGLGFSHSRADSGDAVASLYAKFIPAEKNLSADWIASLTTRGHALDAGISHAKGDADLEVIGMTTGGIGCGTVYLSGDGRLWVWDIFNQHHEGVVANRKAKTPEGLENIQGQPIRERDGSNFVLPPRASEHTGGVDFHVTLDHQGGSRRMDASGWSKVRFTGHWPIGRVRYEDPTAPVAVDLEAFSPFIPLQLEDSSLPVTILDYTLENTTEKEQAVTLRAHLTNPLGAFSNLKHLRATKAIEGKGFRGIQHDLSGKPDEVNKRPDQILFDFENGTYDGWTIEGKAFGSAPAEAATTPAYQGDTGLQGKRYINSHASAPGEGVEVRDDATGTLTSPEFLIERDYINFLVGGGNHKSITSEPLLSVSLLVDGRRIQPVTGHSSNAMRPACFETSTLIGRKARIVIDDQAAKRPWANIGCDHFVQSDTPPSKGVPSAQPDFGSMSMAIFDAGNAPATVENPNLSLRVPLPPKGRRTVRIAITWHLPNLNNATGIPNKKRHYSTRFADSTAVMHHLAKEGERLCRDTRKWVDTWNDSTLPQWLLDRVILTTNTLQTQNCLMFEDGRFWAWEGIGCCQGTCGHVWEYSQGHARLFPEIERRLRTMTDFKIAQKPDGSIRFRGENNRDSAIDSQAGYILRSLRDHQLSEDPDFIRKIWPGVKSAAEYLIRFDGADARGGLDGLLDGKQHNTLDADWYGKVHVLCSMYLAALRAAEELAKAVGDSSFAARTRSVYELGAKNIGSLFNGEYYEQILDPQHDQSIGVGKGCYIDQAMGQFWANQVGLGRLYSAEHQKSALRSLWKYNFVPEYGSFRQAFRQGRHYASRGDSGLVMCTWPKGGLKENFKSHWAYAYFNEFMTGFEYEAAAHMIAERDDDLVLNGLAVARAVHDRYSAARGRNPYNEIECSDHYARAGSSYAVFLALCGFQFDQSRGLLAFDPVIGKDSFRAPFTTSAAWGTYEQKGGSATLTIRHGRLEIRELQLALFKERTPKAVLNGKPVESVKLTLVEGDTLVLS